MTTAGQTIMHPQRARKSPIKRRSLIALPTAKQKLEVTRSQTPQELSLEETISDLRKDSLIVDCGCFGWTLAELCSIHSHRLIGLDRKEPAGKPDWARFATMNDSVIDLNDDCADLTVASHIIEHIQEPISFFCELARITKPGGLIWIEAPSELSALKISTDNPYDNSFESFWDDPTHVRPWTPAALYRLALSCYCRPLFCQRGISGGIPVSRLLAQKPTNCNGRPASTYVSLKDVAPGAEAAWNAIWNQ